MSIITKPLIPSSLIAKNVVFITLAIASIGLALPLQAGELVLADKGQTEYAIVVSADAIKSETYAAEELASYLKKVTGAVFPIVKNVADAAQYNIIVGQNDLSRKILGNETIAALAEEEFIVKTVGTDLLIVGGRPRGTLYGVYEFLEKFAECRFFNWWGDECVPQIEKFTVNSIDFHQSPAFRVRDIVVHTNPYAKPEVFRDFLVRGRCQGPEVELTSRYSPSIGGVDTYGGTAHTYVMPPHMVHSSFWLISSADEHKGHSQISDIFAKHPEYFSFLGGERTPCQLCYSNPEVRRILTERILKRFEEVGGEGILSLSAQDSAGPLCTCPDCSKLMKRQGGTAGAPLFDYLAELGPILKRKYPKAFVSTLAYRKLQSERPPLNFELPDNIIIVFAPIDYNFGASFEDKSNAATWWNIKAWTKATKHLWVWYYPNPYGDPVPIGNFEKLVKDFRFFRNIGVEGFFIEQDAQGVYDSHNMPDLQTWLITKLMWNPDQDFNTLVEDFTEHFYGKAAPFMQKYIYALEKATQGMNSSMGWAAEPGMHNFLTPEFLAESQNIFAQAEEEVSNDPVRLLRVKQARMSLDRASFLFWNKIATIENSGLRRDEIARRYRDTYEITVEKIPQNKDKLPVLRHGAEVEKFLKLWSMMNSATKILPAPFNEIPEGKTKQVTPNYALALCFHTPHATIEKDPDAAIGIAAARESGELPFNVGYFDELTHRQVQRNIKATEIPSNGYNLYKICRTTLNKQCKVWVGRLWTPTFPLSAFYDADHPEKEWDIYVSLRFEGPSYPHGQKSTVDRVLADRVILVPVEE